MWEKLQENTVEGSDGESKQKNKSKGREECGNKGKEGKEEDRSI